MKDEYQVKYRGRIELLLLLRDKNYGFVITYDDLRIVLDRDPQKDGRADIMWVRSRLLRECGKWLENEVGKGYFIAQPNEHAGAAQRYDDQATRKQKTSLDIVINTDTDKLNIDDLRTHRELQKRLAIKYLNDQKINKVSFAALDTVTMPTAKELLEIYRNKRT